MTATKIFSGLSLLALLFAFGQAAPITAQTAPQETKPDASKPDESKPAADAETPKRNRP